MKLCTSTFKEELITGFAKVFKDSGIKIVTYLKYFIQGTKYQVNKISISKTVYSDWCSGVSEIISTYFFWMDRNSDLKVYTHFLFPGVQCFL